ncbi:MAG: SpoIIE family protein phosphatase [Treponema sp.]|nr:SpoIIE family protein phosphatase [Treponema sp.]MBQ4237612.1 SpoIIE family protein phosphatase [Treponema sp.]MBQ5383534.1 SpoIIE family protein phosphatase [Treponema sp.]
MIFMIINFLVGAGLMSFSFMSDHVATGQKEEVSLTNQILMLSSVCLMMGASMLLCYFAPKFLCLLVSRVTYVLMAWFCTGFCKVLISYKSKKRHAFLTVIRWILNVAAFVFIFIVRGINAVGNGADGLYEASSAVVVSLENGITFTFLDFYMIFFIFVIQVLTVLMILVRAENSKDKFIRQSMFAVSLGMVVTWIVYALLFFGSMYQKGLKGLYILALTPELMVYAYSSANLAVWGKTLVRRTLVRTAALYLLPAVLVGGGFVLIYRSFPEQNAGFYAACAVVCAVIYTAILFVSRRLIKTDAMRDGQYAEQFEEAVTSISFDENSKDIEKEIKDAFTKYVETSSVRIAIDAGTGFLETIGENEENKIAVPIDQTGFEVLLNIKHSIVFRTFIEKDYQMKPVREALLEMLDENKADSFILLNEGRRVVGAIFLGPKTSGDAYNKYDYEIFEKLYSNFFVVGYYMKNMMNESVVGTVNREIRMSSQIITSIQENMDYISNPKLDCGYRMVPAHNIGGEFIDMIRLNDTRHMFVIGALSGKGIAASMSMVVLKSVIRTNLAETKDFKLLVEKTNSFIRTGLPKGTFFSGLFGIIDFENDTLYYINCGAPALFMYNRLYNNVIEIQGEGHVLGFAKDLSKLIRVKKVKIAEGDIIMACTDGLIEAKSLRGESYGKTRVQSQIMENATYPADKMGQFIYDNLREFSSRALEDDYTVFVIKKIQ